VWGAAADSSDVLYLRLSHGVGGGLVVGGALHRGRYGLSGEFGHITVDPAGRQCECGKTGCLETRASLDAVLCRYREAGGRADNLDQFLDATSAAERPALEVLERVGSEIGEVLAAVCHAVGPGVIVVGGELAEAGPALLEPVERALRQHLMPMARHHVDVRRATLGEAGSALGGIALVLHESPLLSHYPQPVSEENA
jgi:predicted NBD/HSP70 family sugar kinase